ncbi:hypothetical protein GHT06_018664 [Daphnia sinensis]|uniref:Uncharacterized protein n=1 Tax=Daphnia sinensis TaxID=1820382 RepID=A0AAD5KMT7_9CRUS|nr:hypothetical protein GHT06_018664 [Daphnia sinensis]
MEVIRGKGIDSRHESIKQASWRAASLVCYTILACDAGIVHTQLLFLVRVPSVYSTALDVQMASCFLEMMTERPHQMKLDEGSFAIHQWSA